MRRGFGAVASFDLNFQIFALRDTTTALVWLIKKSFFRSFNSLRFLEFRDPVGSLHLKKRKEKRFMSK